MAGRKTPYTEAGIKRVPCCRCGKPAAEQWQICADGALYRPVCVECDVALNDLVLEWFGFPDREQKMKRYREKML